MPKLVDGQTITSYAIFRIGLKARLHDIDTNVFEKLPIIKEKNGTLIKYLPVSRTTVYAVPDGIIKILKNTFIPNISDRIDEGYYNPLEVIWIPESVEVIKPSAFGCCIFLESIEVDEGNRFFKSVDGVLFSKDGKKLLAFPAGRMEENYIVPEGVEVIGENAFQNSCVYKITMASTVKQIKNNAFWFSYTNIVDFSKARIEKFGNGIFADAINMTVITGSNSFCADFENVKFEQFED